MKKAKEAKKSEVKKDVNEVEAPLIKNGHRWLSWITGISAVWLLIVFIKGLCGDADLPCGMAYLNVWYLVNIAILAVLAGYATLTILKKCTSQIFWSSSTMFLILLQSISLVLLFFFKQDAAAINAIALFVWSVCWYTYMLTGAAVEGDIPSAHRTHSQLGVVILGVMTLSTVAYGIMMSLTLLF